MSGRALRRSVTPSTSPARSPQGEQKPRSLSPIGIRLTTSAETTGEGERRPSGSGSIVGGDGGREVSTGTATPSLGDTPTQHQGGNCGSSEDQLQAESSKRANASRSSLSRRRGRADSTGGKLALGRSPPLSPTASTASGGGSGEPPMISACESDIWAWALMVLQMFSDEAWPPGSGQVRFCTFSLCILYSSVADSHRFSTFIFLILNCTRRGNGGAKSLPPPTVESSKGSWP